MSTGLILYQTDDGLARVQLRSADGSVWLTQLEIAELFATTKQNVSLHAKNILQEGELAADSVVKESLTTAADGKSYRTLLYSLPLILAIGYRVRSPRGTVKTKSLDCVQPAAAFRHAACCERGKPRLQRTYFPTNAARRAARLHCPKLQQAVAVQGAQHWRGNVDRLLEFNDRPVLKNAGSISGAEMKSIAHDRYDIFDSQRRKAEAIAADAEDIKALEAIETQAKRKGGAK